jgi:hypothetical protein
MTTFKIYDKQGGHTEIKTSEPVGARNLDGIYLRVRVDGKWEARCLTDLPADIVETVLLQNAQRAPDPAVYMMSAVEHLRARLRALGDQLDLTSN